MERKKKEKKRKQADIVRKTFRDLSRSLCGTIESVAPNFVIFDINTIYLLTLQSPRRVTREFLQVGGAVSLTFVGTPFGRLKGSRENV